MTGCSWLDRTPDEPDPEVHPDRERLVTARDDQEALLAAVRATVAAHAGLAATLDALAARSEERLAALDKAVGDTATPASPGSPGATTTTPPAVPARPAPAVNALLTQTRAAETARSEACRSASDGGVARLLGALAAGYAQDVVVLRRQRGAV